MVTRIIVYTDKDFIERKQIYIQSYQSYTVKILLYDKGNDIVRKTEESNSIVRLFSDG